MPTNNQNTSRDLRVVKPSFIEFIKLIRNIRLNTFGKHGPIIIPKNELDKIVDLKLDFFIKQLIIDGILWPLDKNKNFHKDIHGNVTVNCNKYEMIDEYLPTLYIPASSGLIIEQNGKHIFRHGQPDRFRDFSEQNAAVLDFLYKNAGRPQRNQDISAGCRERLGINLTETQIRSILYNIRKRIKELGYNENEMKGILPKYTHGGYVLKL